MGVYGRKNQVRYEIVNKLKSNMTLLKFLYYVNETEKDILTFPDLTSYQVKEVTDNYIYRYQKIEGNKDTDKKCYISMNYGLKQYHQENNPYFNGNAFDIYVMCDRDVDFIKSNGSRIDAVEDCIVDMFDDGIVGCIGNSRIDYSEPINIKSSDYVGVHISIVFYDKNGELND